MDIGSGDTRVVRRRRSNSPVSCQDSLARLKSRLKSAEKRVEGHCNQGTTERRNMRRKSSAGMQNPDTHELALMLSRRRSQSAKYRKSSLEVQSRASPTSLPGTKQDSAELVGNGSMQLSLNLSDNFSQENYSSCNLERCSTADSSLSSSMEEIEFKIRKKYHVESGQLKRRVDSQRAPVNDKQGIISTGSYTSQHSTSTASHSRQAVSKEMVLPSHRCETPRSETHGSPGDAALSSYCCVLM